MYNKKAVKFHYFTIIGIIFISLNLQQFSEGVPVESDKGSDDQFIFVLPGAESGSNIYNGLPVSLDLQPPLEPKTRVAKDSYGNPVQSYETIGEVQTGKNGKKIVQANGVQFELPSYASGITGIKEPIDELLPPLTSEEQKDIESLTTYSTDSNSSELSSDPTSSPSSLSTPSSSNDDNVTNKNNNNKKDTTETVSSPPLDLLPPLLADKTNKSNTSDVSTNEISSPGENQTSGSRTPARVPTGRSIITRRNDNGVKGNSQNTRSSSSQDYDNGKYIGGFGGPPGILGEQKRPGYGVRTTQASFRSRTTIKNDRTTTAKTTTTTLAPSTADHDSDSFSTNYGSSSMTDEGATGDDTLSTLANEQTSENTEASPLSTVDDTVDTTHTPVEFTDDSVKIPNTETLSTHDYKTSTVATTTTTTTTSRGHTSFRKQNNEAPKRRISPLSKLAFDSFTSTTPASTTIKSTSKTFPFVSSTTKYTTVQATTTSTTSAPYSSPISSTVSEIHSPNTFDSSITSSQTSSTNDDYSTPSILLSPPFPSSNEEAINHTTTSTEFPTKLNSFEINPTTESNNPSRHTQTTVIPTPNRFAFGINRALTDAENSTPSPITTQKNQISSRNPYFGRTPSSNQPKQLQDNTTPTERNNDPSDQDNSSGSKNEATLPSTNPHLEQKSANNSSNLPNWQNPTQPPLINSPGSGTPSQNPSQDNNSYGSSSPTYSNEYATQKPSSNSYQIQSPQFGAPITAPSAAIPEPNTQASPQNDNSSPSSTFGSTYPVNTPHQQQSPIENHRFSFGPIGGSFPNSNPYAPNTQQTSYTPQYNPPNSLNQQTSPQNPPNSQLFPSPFISNNYPNIPTQIPSYSQNNYQNQFPQDYNNNPSNYPYYNTQASSPQNQGIPQSTNQSPYANDNTYNQNQNRYVQNYPSQQPSFLPNTQQQFGYHNNPPYNNPYQSTQQYPNSVQNRFNPNPLSPNFNLQIPQLSSPSPFQQIFTPFTPQQNTQKTNVPHAPGGTFDFQGNQFISAQHTSPNHHPGSSLTPNYGNNLNTGNNPQFTGTGRPTLGFENPSSFLVPSSSGSSSPLNPSIPSSSSGAFHNSQSSASSLNIPSNVNSNNNDGKYSGTFGGAAGILGDQKRPGYAVQTDGSIKDPDNAYKPTATGAIETPQTPQTPSIPAPQNSISAGEKYVGGFGGPPGILTPYDNQKSG